MNYIDKNIKRINHDKTIGIIICKKNNEINKNDLDTYYNVDKMLSEAGKHYGKGIIKEYSKRLTYELGKGYTQSRSRYIRRFFEVFSKMSDIVGHFAYSHYCKLKKKHIG